MSQVTKEQIAALAAQLGAIASIFNPTSGAAVGGLIQAGATLYGLLGQIRANDPAMWEAVSQDWRASVAAFEAAIPAAPAMPPPSTNPEGG